MYPFASDLAEYGKADGSEDTCHSLVVDLTFGRHQVVVRNDPEQAVRAHIENKRDALRWRLLERKAITSLVSEESLFVS